jgi:hypothetical protein
MGAGADISLLVLTHFISLLALISSHCEELGGVVA